MQSLPPFRPLLISPSWPAESSTNGVVVHVHHLVDGLRRLGHSPLVATPSLSGSTAHVDDVFPLNDGPLTRLAERLRYRFSGSTPVDCLMARRIRSLVGTLHRRGQVDVVQIEEAWGTAAHLTGRLPVPVHVRLHGPWFLTAPADGVPQDTKFKQKVELEGRAIAVADGVSAPSRYVLDATREHYQIPLDGARVIPNCTRPVSAERQWAGGQSDSPVILFVGRFDAIKGGDLVLKAFNEVHKRSPDARLVFIGPDPGVRLADGHVCKFAEFVSRSLSAGASRRVEYLGRRSSTEIENWRQRASVTVLASRFDNFPNTALEAIAYGSPTVSTAVGGIPEILQNEVSGILVPPESAEALAAGILRLLDDHSLAMRLGRAAAADAHARFHPVSCAEQMLQAYFETLPARRISA